MWTRVINRGPGNVDLFRSQLNRLFSDFEDSYSGVGRSVAMAPRTNMSDSGDRFVLKAEVPGMTREDLQIRIQGNYLELSGSRQAAVPDGFKAHRTERRAASFIRSFTLAADVDVEKVEAELGDGILTVILPKEEAAKVKQIEIK